MSGITKEVLDKLIAEREVVKSKALSDPEYSVGRLEEANLFRHNLLWYGSPTLQGIRLSK